MCWHAVRGGNLDTRTHVGNCNGDCLQAVYTHVQSYTRTSPLYLGWARAPCGEQKRNVIYSCLLIHTIAFPNRVLQTIRCIPLYHFLKIALFPSTIIPTSWLLIHQGMLPDSEPGKLPSLSLQITTWILLLNSGKVKFSPFAKRGSYDTQWSIAAGVSVRFDIMPCTPQNTDRAEYEKGQCLK